MRRRLAKRAGLPAQASPTFGALRGSLDLFGSDGLVRGWARDAAFPEAPVCLDLILDGALVARALADHHRPDLEADGVGDGRHAFETRLSATPASGWAPVLEARRSGDGALLGERMSAEPEAAA